MPGEKRDPRDARIAELEANLQQARRALEAIGNGSQDVVSQRLAREALAAMDTASGAEPPPAAGSPGEGLPEREYAALCRVAEAAEGIMAAVQGQENWTWLKDALAELRRAREGRDG